MKGSEITKYYFAGATRIAMRKYTIPQNGSLTYLLSDHLGSSSVAVDATPGEVIKTLYRPWGEVRFATAGKSLPTRYTFTGQFSHVTDEATDLGSAGLGLIFYQSRMYDPVLGRFSSPDTIIPSTQGVQGWDRYAYVNNNPIRYNDPTGHMCSDPEDPTPSCENGRTPPPNSGGGGNRGGGGGDDDDEDVGGSDPDLCEIYDCDGNIDIDLFSLTGNNDNRGDCPPDDMECIFKVSLNIDELIRLHESYDDHADNLRWIALAAALAGILVPEIIFPAWGIAVFAEHESVQSDKVASFFQSAGGEISNTNPTVDVTMKIGFKLATEGNRVPTELQYSTTFFATLESLEYYWSH